VAFTIQPATAVQLGKWDSLVRDFEGGTLFQEHAFLNYHGDRFRDKELFFVVLKGEAILGLLAGTINKEAEKVKLVSPYGGSFGGPIFRSRLVLKDAIEIMDLYRDLFRKNGITDMIFTLPPAIYSANTDLLEYCLLRNGYTISKADVFNIVPIRDTPGEVQEAYEGRVRTTLRKEKELYIIQKDADIAAFYEILLIDKKEKNTLPTHSLADLLYLKNTFPDRIRVDLARHKETGAQFTVCYFRVNREGWMTFYIAQDRKELRLNGVTVLIDDFLCGMAGKYKFLDFGGSTFGYEITNPGIANFKESFGAISQLRKTFITYG
jgi:hypothetical protein